MPSYPIVGAYHHPPAQALLSVLSAGAVLVLRPEPTNAFDVNALQVLLPHDELARVAKFEKPRAILERELPNFGYTLEELLDQGSDIMLGYIARRHAETLAPILAGSETKALLTFASSGAPQAQLPDFPTKEAL